MDEEENQKLLPDAQDGNSVNYSPGGAVRPRVYKRRWYILFVFCLMSFAGYSASGSLGNVAHAAEKAFCWTDADIAVIGAWQPIAFLVSVPFFTWLLDSKGYNRIFLLHFYII